MKPFTATIFCAVVAFTIISSSNAASLGRVRRQAIPREFANINIENYLKNERAVAFQLKCIVYDGPCDRIGKYLKVTIPELLTNQCTNCDPAQRQRAGRLVQHIQQKFPKEWADAVQKFQGGQVKKADADRLESLLGVKLDSKLVAPEVTTTTTTTTTEAPSSTAAPTVVPAVAIAEISSTAAPVSSSTSEVPAVSSSVAPIVVADVSSTSAPVADVSTSSVAPVVSSSEAPVVSSSSVPVVEISSSVAPEVVVSSSVAPVVSSSAAPEVSSTTTTSSTSEASASSPPTSDAPASPASSSPATVA